VRGVSVIGVTKRVEDAHTSGREPSAVTGDRCLCSIVIRGSERLESLSYIHASLRISTSFGGSYLQFRLLSPAQPASVLCWGVVPRVPLSSASSNPAKEMAGHEQTTGIRRIRAADFCCYDGSCLGSITTIVTTADALAARCNRDCFLHISERSFSRSPDRRVGTSRSGACLDILCSISGSEAAGFEAELPDYSTQSTA
jgi:hypothetical protein